MFGESPKESIEVNHYDVRNFTFSETSIVATCLDIPHTSSKYCQIYICDEYACNFLN